MNEWWRNWSSVSIKPRFWWRLKYLFRPHYLVFCWDGAGEHWFIAGFDGEVALSAGTNTRTFAW